MSAANEPPTNQEVLQALRRWARESGLSQSEIERRTGITQSTLSRYLRGGSHKLQQRTIEALVRRIPPRLLLEERSSTSPFRSDPSAPYTVFVSSTYLDNVQRRAWVREAIERAGMQALAMERWTADKDTVRASCVHRIREADVFVGILAWRYGWIPEGETKSVTELEYDEAGRLNLPRLMFLIDQPLDKVNLVADFDPDDRWRKQALLEVFKERVRSEQTAMPFQDGNLQTLVLQALFEWKERRSPDISVDRKEEVGPMPLMQGEQALADYMQAVEAEHAHVVLPGFESKFRVPLLLDDLYVPIDLTADSPFDDVGPIHREKMGPFAVDPSPQGSTLTLAQALGRVGTDTRLRGLVVLGHPGSGKTTQLRRLALSLVRGRLEPAQDRVPVFLPMRKLKPQDQSLAGFARRLLADDDIGLGPDFAEWLWERGGLLLLVDGLDEVARERRAEITEWIETVARGRKRNLLVVTCRYEGYERSVRLGLGFLALSMRPLTDEGVADFVKRWYEAVETSRLPSTARERERDNARRSASEASNDLVDRLHKESARAMRVYELAHNPLLLTAICLVHRDHATLPDHAAELYQQTVDVLLQHWREAKRLPLGFEAKIARQVLQPVALWLHEVEGRTQGTEEELCAVLGPAMAEAKWRELAPKAFLASVRDESGLLTGWSADRYGFLHLGFQEYLSAQAMFHRVLGQAGNEQGFKRELDAVVQRFGPSWWREVLCLLFALDERGILFKPLFDRILRLPHLEQHAHLASQCALESPHFSPEPFRELLRLPAGAGLWANRGVATGLILSRGPLEVFPEDVAPALGLLARPPSTRSEFHREQLAALILVLRLSPEALDGRLLERLVRHPLGEIGRLAALRMPQEPAEPGARTIAKEVQKMPRTRVEEPSGCELVLIPGGSFVMGSAKNEPGHFEDEGPAHEVTVDPIYLAIHPVTNEQYARFLQEQSGIEPPTYWGDRRYNQPRQPVVGVSWKDAQAYCKWAGLRLPTEAEWEYACRAGTTTPYWAGKDEADLGRVAWYKGNSDGRLHSVGEKPASPFGLFDMHGNVWEWCEDGWSVNYVETQKALPGANRNPRAGYRVYRGGSFANPAMYARSAFRYRWRPEGRSAALGFRPARGITPG